MAVTTVLSNLADIFPVGTPVGAYAASQRHSDAAPTGSALETENVSTAGSVTFTGLSPYSDYVAYAAVSGHHRYVSFATGATSGTPTLDPSTFWASDREVADAIEAKALELEADLAADSSAAAAALLAHAADTTAVHGIGDTANLVLRSQITGVPTGFYNAGDSTYGTFGTQAALQGAIDAAETAGGGIVYVPPGVWTITGISIPANVELMGAGWRTVLTVGTSAGLYPIYVEPGATDVRLHDFAINGNKAAIQAANPSWDPDTLPDALHGPAAAIFAGGKSTGCQRVYVERVRVHDSFRLGIVFQSVLDGAVRNCTVEDNNRDGITLYYDTKNIVISGNTVNRCGDDHIGINSENESPYGHLCESIAVTGNTITGPSARNKGPGITIRGGKDIAVTGNTIRDVCQSAITVNDFATTPATDIVIQGNTIYRPGLNGSSDKYGINVNPSSAGVQRLTITGNNIRSTGQASIRFFDSKGSPADDDIRDILIASNSVQDSGAEGIVTGSAGINDVLVIGNRVKGSTGIGIDFPAGKRISAKANVVYRGANKGIRFSGVNSGTIEVNSVYDDRGGSATQTDGIYVSGLGGTFRITGNLAWGNTGQSYNVNNGTHSATFAGPREILSATLLWNPASVADGAFTSTTVTVTGAVVGAPVTLGFDQSVPAGVQLTGSVTASNTVTATLINHSGGAVDLASGTLFVQVELPAPF